MLTGETTGGDDPQIVVVELARQLENDETELIENSHFSVLREPERVKLQENMGQRMASAELSQDEHKKLRTMDFAIAAVFRANTYGAIGIFPFTANAGTVKAMSRFYPETHVYAITPCPETAQQLLLFRCTHPILIDIDKDLLESLM